jgi:hypothetical protein
MTTILRDSLGGNTHTVMIATLGAAEQQMDESISTCRFAQRVAKVSNQVFLFLKEHNLDLWICVGRTLRKSRAGSSVGLFLAGVCGDMSPYLRPSSPPLIGQHDF